MGCGAFASAPAAIPAGAFAASVDGDLLQPASGRARDRASRLPIIAFDTGGSPIGWEKDDVEPV